MSREISFCFLNLRTYQPAGICKISLHYLPGVTPANMGVAAGPIMVASMTGTFSLALILATFSHQFGLSGGFGGIIATYCLALVPLAFTRKKDSLSR